MTYDKELIRKWAKEGSVINPKIVLEILDENEKLIGLIEKLSETSANLSPVESVVDAVFEKRDW